MKEFYIETITRSDFKSLLNLFKELSQYLKQPHRMINSMQKMEQEADLIQGFVAKDHRGNVVGYTTYFVAYHTWSGKSLYMDDLYIRELYRGKGIGKQLIEEVIKYAKTNNCYKLSWQVSNWNKPAIAFYESLGATIDSIELNCNLVLENDEKQ